MPYYRVDGYWKIEASDEMDALRILIEKWKDIPYVMALSCKTREVTFAKWIAGHPHEGPTSEWIGSAI